MWKKILFPGKYIQGAGALAELPALVKRFGSHGLILASPTAYKAHSPARAAWTATGTRCPSNASPVSAVKKSWPEWRQSSRRNTWTWWWAWAAGKPSTPRKSPPTARICRSWSSPHRLDRRALQRMRRALFRAGRV